MSARDADDLAERNAEREPGFSICMTEAEMSELSFGRVPAWVQELAATLVELRENAAKPMRQPRKKRPVVQIVDRDKCRAPKDAAELLVEAMTKPIRRTRVGG